MNDSYYLDLKVYPEYDGTDFGKVRVRLYKNGEEQYYAYARIGGEGEYGLVQAISYALHMIMKMSEQKQIAAEVNT